MKVAIITEGGKKFGFGHLARCIALYQAFEEKKIIPELIVNGDNTVLGLLKGKNFLFFNWLKEERIWRQIKGSMITIIDSYMAPQLFYQESSKLSQLTVSIDDFKRLNYPSGIVVNGSLYAKKIRYPINMDVTYLLGTKYIPLRKEFWRVPGKVINKNIRSVMLILGASDVRNIMPKIIQALNRECPLLKKYVIIGGGFRNIDNIRKLRNEKTCLVYRPDAREIKRIMLKSDVVISAGGQTLYEAARIGVPTIAIDVIYNQFLNVKIWHSSGFLKYAGNWKDARLCQNIITCIKGLNDRKDRLEMSLIGRKVVDGQGSRRIIEYLCNRHN